MPRTIPSCLVLAAVALLLAALPAAAAARTGPCLPDAPGGPACAVWSGKVTFVADGDTLDVDLAGDGTAGPARIRVTGVQAMEQTVYSRFARRRRGACHALAATARLERLVRAAGGRVRLAAQDPRSRSAHRLRRALAVRIGGRWVDVGRTLLAEGHALWLPNPVEFAWNASYGRAAEDAAAAGIGLWDGEACAAGPDARLRLRVTWDARGNDVDNVNGEWFAIESQDRDRDVALGGWWVRDSALRRYTFPPGTVLPAGGVVRVHVGAGSATATRHFWGLGAPAFENAGSDGRSMGDGGYLFDPDGDLRAWEIYR